MNSITVALNKTCTSTPFILTNRHLLLLFWVCVLLPAVKKLVLNLLLFYRFRSVRKETSPQKDSNDISRGHQDEGQNLASKRDALKTHNFQTNDSLSRYHEVPILRKLPPRDKDLSHKKPRQTTIKTSHQLNPYDNFGPSSSVQSQLTPIQHRSKTQTQPPLDNALSGGSLPENRTFSSEIPNQSCQSSLAIQAVYSLMEICNRNDISAAKPIGNYVPNHVSRVIPGSHSEVKNCNNGTECEPLKKKRKLSFQSSLTVEAVFSLLEICSQNDISTSRSKLNHNRGNSSRAASTVQSEVNIGNSVTYHETSRKRRRQSGTSDPNGITKAACVLSSMKVMLPNRNGSIMQTTSNSNIENDDVYALLSLKKQADNILNPRPYSAILRQQVLTS